MNRRISPVGFILFKYNIFKESKHSHNFLDHEGKIVHEGWGRTMKETEMRKGPFYVREVKYKTEIETLVLSITWPFHGFLNIQWT